MTMEHARSLQKAGQLQEAFDIYVDQLRLSRNKSYAAAYGAARCAGDLRDFAKSAQYFATAAQLSPDRHEPLLELANVQYRLHEYRKALLSLDKAAQITPPTDKVSMMRVRLLNALGEFDRVVQLCDRADPQDLTPQQAYAWTVRKIRGLYMQGDVARADHEATRLLLSDGAQYAQWAGQSGESTAETPTFDVLLNNYQRPESVRFQRWWLDYQSVKANRFLVWHNDGGTGVNHQALPGSENALNDINHKFYGRFAFALMSKADYIAVFDDDTIPGTHWIRNCLDTGATRKALMGTIGVSMVQADRYTPNTRTGWIGSGQETTQQVDLAGHAWFIPRDWLRYFWYEKPSTFATGEDMHISFSAQKHANAATLIPAHPAKCPGAWGSILGEELGMDNSASYKRKGSTHYSERDYCVQDLVARGWRLKNI